MAKTMGAGNGKKIIQHLLYSGLGGHGSVFFSLVEADDKQEFEYRAVFCGIEKLREEYSENCRRLKIPFEMIEKKRGFDAGVYWKLFREFKRNRPATIFLHGVSFLMPAVWYKMTRPATKIIVRDTQAHHLKSRAEWFWLFFCLWFAKKIVLLSQASVDRIKQKMGWLVRKEKLVIIPNGMNLAKYQPVYHRTTTSRQLAIGMQSRLQPIKDHPTLLRAFKKVRELLPDYPVSLHIAGDGETMQAIKSLISELGLNDSVYLHGRLNEKELLSFMQSLDIYVHATFGEMMSNSIMQAMACGLPIIASDVWGVNNMISEGENGLLYSGENAEQLAGLLAQLVISCEKRNELGLRARKFAENNYSNEIMFRRYRDLYLL